MYVKRSGGISNRPGFEHVKVSQTQESIPNKGMPQEIKGFTWWSPEAEDFVTIEYAHHAVLGRGFFIDGNAPSASLTFSFTGPPVHKVRFVPLKDRIFITPPAQLIYDPAYDALAGSQTQNVALSNEVAGVLAVEDRYGNFFPNLGITIGGLTVGISTGPWIPAAYLVTYVLEDGQEKILGESYDTAATGVSTARSPAMPHAQCTHRVDLTLSAALPQVKGFNFYRGSGYQGLGHTYFKLVGRVPYNGTALSVKFTDYGADDPSQTPPLDNSMMRGATGPVNGYLDGVNCAAYFQQRLIMGMEPGITPSIKAGDICVSAVGVPEQVRAPVVFSNTGAFKFSIPVKDGTPPVAFLSMERLIAFTQRGVYVMQGGEQGVLTPTSLNPALISEEGCSKLVEPKISGTRGYFLNAAHTKLMSIKFTVDGNLEVTEASRFSSHLIKKGVMELEVITGEEDQIYLVTHDGDLVVATVNEEGVHGFSTYDTNGGYVEGIFRGKGEKLQIGKYFGGSRPEPLHDVLMVHMIRNGVRMVERLGVRDDSSKLVECFADGFIRFGRILRESAETSGYYQQHAYGADPFPFEAIFSPLISIEDSGEGWNAGAELNFKCSDWLVLPPYGPESMVLHFFYKNSEGKEQVARATIDTTDYTDEVGDTTFGAHNPDGEVRVYKGSFDVEVPEQLREGGDGSVPEITVWSRWLPAFNKISHNTYYPEFGLPALDENTLYPVWIAGKGEDSDDAPVSLVADGEILSSPLNPNKPTLNITKAGDVLTLELGDYFCNGYVGLPYESEFETLDIETGDNRTLTDSNKLINAFGMGVLETRGGFFGMPGMDIEDMEEAIIRNDGDASQQVTNKNGYLEVPIPAEWNGHGRVAAKNVDPVPMTILSVYPKGIAGN